MHHGIFQSSQQYWTYRWCQSSWFRCTSGSAWQPEQHCSCSISKQSSHWGRQMLLTDGTPSMNRNNWGEESNRNRHPEGENANSPGILVTCSPTLTTPSPWRQTAINDVPNNGAKLIISGFFILRGRSCRKSWDISGTAKTNLHPVHSIWAGPFYQNMLPKKR